MKKIPFFSVVFFIIMIALVVGYVYVTTRQGSQVFYRTDNPQPQNIQAQNVQDASSRVLSSLSVPLLEHNESGEFGSAEFIEEKGQTKITVVLTGEMLGNRQAVLHRGVCNQLGDAVQSLSIFESGVSETVLEIALEEMVSQLPLTVVVRNVDDLTQNIITCGELAVY